MNKKRVKKTSLLFHKCKILHVKICLAPDVRAVMKDFSVWNLNFPVHPLIVFCAQRASPWRVRDFSHLVINNAAAVAYLMLAFQNKRRSSANRHFTEGGVPLERSRTVIRCRQTHARYSCQWRAMLRGCFWYRPRQQDFPFLQFNHLLSSDQEGCWLMLLIYSTCIILIKLSSGKSGKY